MVTSNRKQWGYRYVADFSAIAQGGSSTVNLRIDADTDFTMLTMLCSANLSSTNTVKSRSNIVGIDTGNANTNQFLEEDLATLAKLYRDSDPNAAVISNAGLHLITLAFQLNDRTWQSSAVRADLMTGEPGKLLIEPAPPLLPANSVLQITAYNNLPATLGSLANPKVDVQVVLAGYKQIRSADGN